MWTWIKALFNRLLRAFRAFLAEALPVAKQIIMEQLQDFALVTVASLNKEAIESEQKRKVALERIKQYAINNGIKVSDSLINTLIELAVQKYKEAE